MSAGVDSQFGGHNAYEKAVKSAAKSGTIVVAAAGNSSKVKRLAYPARAPDAVCVSGCVSRCQVNPDEHLDDRRLWMEGTEFSVGPYCTGSGCTKRGQCTNQSHEWWGGNVEPMGHKPDSSASAVHFTGRNRNPVRKGTSFAAPLVTGAIGRLVQQFDDELPIGEDLSELIRLKSRFLNGIGDPRADHNRQQFATDRIRDFLKQEQ